MSTHHTPTLVSILVSAVALGAGCTVGEPGTQMAQSGSEAGAADASISSPPPATEEVPDADGGVLPPDADGGVLPPDADGGVLPPEEVLNVTFTTTPRGGQFAPANVVATWIEDAAGTFVATIDRQSAVRTQYLLAWNAVVPAGLLQDAVSGATRPNHALPVTAVWSIPPELPDGDYTVRIETSEVNAVTPDENAQATFLFSKNGIASTVTPIAPDGYLNVTIDYTGR